MHSCWPRDHERKLSIRYRLLIKEKHFLFIYLFIYLFNHLSDRLCIYLAIYIPSTFEDRSHVFNLVPQNLKTSQPIKYILGIGKRGNIEEAFPSMEYRFVPEKLTVTTDQYVCFAWAGKSVHP